MERLTERVYDGLIIIKQDSGDISIHVPAWGTTKHWKSRFHANLKNMFQIFRTIYFPLKNVRNAEHLFLVKK